MVGGSALAHKARSDHFKPVEMVEQLIVSAYPLDDFFDKTALSSSVTTLEQNPALRLYAGFVEEMCLQYVGRSCC